MMRSVCGLAVIIATLAGCKSATINQQNNVIDTSGFKEALRAAFYQNECNTVKPDKVVFRDLEYGKTYRFNLKANNTRSEDRLGINKLNATIVETKDFNGGENPSFSWTREFIEKKYILEPEEVGFKVFLSKEYAVKHIPEYQSVKGKDGDILIAYKWETSIGSNGEWKKYKSETTSCVIYRIVF